jgi:flagellar protein FlgJ
LNAAAVEGGAQSGSLNNSNSAEVAGAPQNSGVNGAGNIDRSKFVGTSRFMRKPVDKTPETKLREVSDMYEKHFLREMTKAMRSTVHEGGFIQMNQAEKIFREQLDEHYVEKWGEKGGIGLSDMIYKQLIEKFGVAMGIKARVDKPRGPLPLDRAKNFQHPGKSKSTLSYKIDVAPEIQGGGARPGSRDVKAPWAGAFGAVTTLADNQTQVEIEHDNGLKSQVVFKGTVAKLSTGQKVQAGDTLGFLSSEAKSIYWTVETDKSPRPQTVSE